MLSEVAEMLRDTYQHMEAAEHMSAEALTRRMNEAT